MSGTVGRQLFANSAAVASPSPTCRNGQHKLIPKGAPEAPISDRLRGALLDVLHLERVLAARDQTSPEADQASSDADQVGSLGDQAAAAQDQVASDSDQAAADTAHAAHGAPTPTQEQRVQLGRSA